jgi:hypothetical protein
MIPKKLRACRIGVVYKANDLKLDRSSTRCFFSNDCIVSDRLEKVAQRNAIVMRKVRELIQKFIAENDNFPILTTSHHKS